MTKCKQCYKYMSNDSTVNDYINEQLKAIESSLKCSAEEYMVLVQKI